MTAARRKAAIVLAGLVTMALAATPELSNAQDTGAEAEANALEAGAVQQDATGSTQEADTAIDRSDLTDPEVAELDAQTAEVAAELRCLVCRNQSVLESNAELSREMQSLIRERLAAGDTPEEVKEYFVSRYGEFVLLQPRARGVNLLVYALPGVALLLGFLVARNRLRKWASSGADAAAAADGEGLAADDEEWLRDALRED